MHVSLTFRLLLPAFCWFLSALPGAAQFALGTRKAATRAAMVPEVRQIAPGTKFSVALSLEHPGGWHSYYRNSGGPEVPLSIDWRLPDGFSAGPIQWPVPEVKDGFFGKSFIHQGSPVFLVDITVKPSVKPGATVSLTADAAWQICKESCIDEKASFTLSLPVGEQPEIDPARQELFRTARASQPPHPQGWTFEVHGGPGDVELRVVPAPGQEIEPTDFVPDQAFVLPPSAGGSVKRDGNAWVLRLPRATRDALDREIPPGDTISGILTGDRPVAVPPTRITRAEQPLPMRRFLPVLGGMLLGGLILNLMPCVFPVIGLKIMGFVQQAGADRRKIVLHGLVFAIGVLATFGLLSGILFAARSAAGGGLQTIGWGYQLQNPWVVLSLLLLIFVLALNMFGVFEIGTSATSIGGSLQAKHGIAGSFFSGVLATVVATPCSAPFLGAAIGAAIALPAAQFFPAFGAMALGLALPYLVLSLFPKLLDFLPRPGAWMESFKQAMSFLLFATAGYLLWVYGGLIDAENLLGPLFGLTCVAVAAWIHGRWNLPHRRRVVRLSAAGMALAFATAGVFLARPPQPSAIDWQTWSPELEQELLEKGRPVYIDFTARWCATCQVNKKRAYTREVVALMKQKRVAALRADKTKANPAIEEALGRYGRSAIPVNVLLAPGRDPIVLPELLTPADLTGALNGL